MAKFHIKKDGTPGQCHANKGNCPLGGSDSHFESAEAAQEESQKRLESQFGVVTESESNIPISFGEYTGNALDYTTSKTLDSKTYFKKEITPAEFTGHLDANGVTLTDDLTPEQMKTVGHFRYKIASQIRNLSRLAEINNEANIDTPLGQINKEKGAKVTMSAEEYSKIAKTLSDDNFKYDGGSDTPGKYTASVQRILTPRSLKTISNLGDANKENNLLENSVSYGYLKTHKGLSDKEIAKIGETEDIYKVAQADLGMQTKAHGIPSRMAKVVLVNQGVSEDTIKRSKLNGATGAALTTVATKKLSKAQIDGLNKLEKHTIEGYKKLDII